MPTPLVVLLVAAAAITLVALVGSAVGLWGSTRRLSRSVGSVRDDLAPRLQQVGDDVAVAQQELDRVRDAVDEWKDGRR